MALLVVIALGLASCTGSVEETGNGAIASPGDVLDGAAGNGQSQADDDPTTSTDESSVDGALPPESETGIGDDPAGEGSRVVVDEPEPVVESADGQSSEPVNGGAEPADGAGTQVGAAMPPSAAEVCAVVEFGYLGLLEGDRGAAIQERLRDGAVAASTSSDERYASAGAVLLDSVGSDGMSDAADAFLAICATDGFERLA